MSEEIEELKKEVKSLKKQVKFALMAIKVLVLHTRSDNNAPNVRDELRTIDNTLEINYKKFEELAKELED